MAQTMPASWARGRSGNRPSSISVNTRPLLAIDAIVPLALLEAVRSLDAPTPDALDEYHDELASKRLGMSRMVSVQIDRYRALAAKRALVDAEEVVALLRLVGRRGDAGLVYANAGRRAAQYARRRIGLSARLIWRMLPRLARNRFGFRLARRVVARIFDIDLARDDARIVAVANDPAWARATPDGAACGLYASAVAAVLRALTDFDGAIVHHACSAHGAEQCWWDTTTLEDAHTPRGVE